MYRGRDTRLDRIVAIKVPAPGLAKDITSRLHDIGREMPSGTDDPAVDFLVMEHLEGETLSARLARSKRMSVEEVPAIAIPVTAALAELSLPTVSSPLTVKGTSLGTQQYMAPEQLAADAS